MTKPTEKGRAINRLLDELSPSSLGRVASIQTNVCSCCGKEAGVFKDALSKKEFSISGFCQICQDQVFKEDE
jgi:hypothetical protein